MDLTWSDAMPAQILRFPSRAQVSQPPRDPSPAAPAARLSRAEIRRTAAVALTGRAWMDATQAVINEVAGNLAAEFALLDRYGVRHLHLAVDLEAKHRHAAGVPLSAVEEMAFLLAFDGGAL
jgi:hypothetical protein